MDREFDMDDRRYEEAGHVPVMVDEVLSELAPQPGEVMLDCTVGRGGHCRAILPHLTPGGRYIGLDADPANLTYVRSTIQEPPVPLDLLHRNFVDAEEVLAELGVERVDLLLADLGFASPQMDNPERGFSFSEEGPLDMRLDPTQPRTAADLINRLPERELADLIWRYGEERFSRKIARKVVDRRKRRPITTTSELAEICASVYGGRGARVRIHPATRTFMALRIAVNEELERLEKLLGKLDRLVRPGGRVVMISFHSLEDRLVKQTFRAYAAEGQAERLTKKPLAPGQQERDLNPRARSAKLRAIRWLSGPGPA